MRLSICSCSPTCYSKSLCFKCIICSSSNREANIRLRLIGAFLKHPGKLWLSMWTSSCCSSADPPSSIRPGITFLFAEGKKKKYNQTAETPVSIGDDRTGLTSNLTTLVNTFLSSCSTCTPPSGSNVSSGSADSPHLCPRGTLLSPHQVSVSPCQLDTVTPHPPPYRETQLLVVS